MVLKHKGQGLWTLYVTLKNRWGKSRFKCVVVCAKCFGIGLLLVTTPAQHLPIPIVVRTTLLQGYDMIGLTDVAGYRLGADRALSFLNGP